jgi:hypothetical protein
MMSGELHQGMDLLYLTTVGQSQPRYDGYERKTDRAIPVIRLSRAG